MGNSLKGNWRSSLSVPLREVYGKELILPKTEKGWAQPSSSFTTLQPEEAIRLLPRRETFSLLASASPKPWLSTLSHRGGHTPLSLLFWATAEHWGNSFYTITRNSTTRGEKNTLKLSTSNSNSAAPQAQREWTRFCQFVPSVQLVQLIQVMGSAASTCKDHSQHLFTLNCYFPPCHPSRGREYLTAEIWIRFSTGSHSPVQGGSVQADDKPHVQGREEKGQGSGGGGNHRPTSQLGWGTVMKTIAAGWVG